MKKIIFASYILSLLACSHNKGTKCAELNGEPFLGEALVFYHKPISGSTYELFLFPVCSLPVRESGIIWDSLGTGISFNLPSDDPRFKLLTQAVIQLPLNVKETLGNNFKTIYVCTAQVNISDYLNSRKEDKVTKDLDMIVAKAKLDYRFAFPRNFVVSDVRPLHFP